MKNTPSPLGAQIATLRDAAQAEENCALWLAPLHAFIMACLARLFARLEQIFRLWHAGQLPALPVRPAPQPRTPTGTAIAPAPRPVSEFRTRRKRKHAHATTPSNHQQSQRRAAQVPRPARQAGPGAAARARAPRLPALLPARCRRSRENQHLSMARIRDLIISIS